MNPWRDLRALPREMWVLAAATAINRAGMMALPFLVLYLTEALHLSESDAGFTLSLYGIGSLLTSPLAGRLSDRYGPLLLMRLSLLLSGILLLCFPWVRNYFAILSLVFLWAVVSEAFRPASMAIISDWVAPEQRKAAFALNRLAINLGMSIGPAAGGFIAAISFAAVFLIDGATAIIAGLILAFSALRPVVPHAANPEHAASRSVAAHAATVFTDRRFFFFLAALLPVTVVFFQHNSTLPLFLVRDLQLPESRYGILFAINTVMIILLEVPLNTGMSHWPYRRALSLGCLLWGVGFGALIFTTNFAGAAFSVAVWTFGEMILFPGAAAYVSEIAPAERRGVYMGIYQMSFSLAFILAPLLGTHVLERFGATAWWSATFALGCLSAAMMWRIAAPAAAGKNDVETEKKLA